MIKIRKSYYVILSCATAFGLLITIFLFLTASNVGSLTPQIYKNNTISTVIDNNRTLLSASSWSLYVWVILFAWQIGWLGYILSYFMCGTRDVAVNVWNLITFKLSCYIQIVWLLLFLNEMFVLSLCSSILLTISLSFTLFYATFRIESKLPCKASTKMIYTLRVLIENGLAFYVAHIFIVSFQNLDIIFVKGLNISLFTTGTALFSVMIAMIIAYSVTDIIFGLELFRYLFTPYIVWIWDFLGIINSHSVYYSNKTNAITIAVTVFTIILIVIFLAKVMFGIYKIGIDTCQRKESVKNVKCNLEYERVQEQDQQT